MDDALGFDTSSDEEHAFTLLSECDLQLTLDWLERCELIVKAYGLGAAAGRAEFVVCEIAATLLVPDTTAGELLGEARLLLSLPALVGAVEAGRLRLPHARRVLSELLPVEEALHDHRAKQAGWIPSSLPDGSTLWLAPSGRTHRKPAVQ